MEKNQIPQIKPKSILDPPDSKKEDESNGIRKIDLNKKSGRLKSLKRRRVAMVLSVFLLFVILIAVFLVAPLYLTYKNSRETVARAHALRASFDSQDIEQVENEINLFNQSLLKLDGSYSRLRWAGYLPFVGVYWRDGKAGIEASKYAVDTAALVVEAVKPYADIIGFGGKNGEAASGEETANDRIEFLVQTIEGVLPKMDEIVSKAKLAEGELSSIDTARYPKEFRGIEIRAKLERLIDLGSEGARLLSQSKPLLEAAPYMLGVDGERTYLVLFQNDKELRPTGGFITAYSIMKVNNGKMEQVVSSDIYNLDSNYIPQIAAPEPIIKYLKGPYVLSPKMRLRDMNWSPDFKESMDLFTEESEEAGIDGIDGVIAVDTQVVVYILDVLGEIGVPGYGNFSTKTDPRCECPQVIYELESFADVEGPVVWSENEPGKIVYAPENYDNRKKIVGPLMNSIISNALGQEKEKLPSLFLAGWKSLTEKHLLFYMFDEKAQAGVEAFNIAGRVLNFDGDYLYINDANLGGRKSNLYITVEVSQMIELESDGSVIKTLDITYKNTKDYDGWLNSVLPNWTRIYVPKGSELISIDGFEDEGEVYEELGKTVFSGGFELRPLGVKKIGVKYKLPFKFDGGNYKLMIQKQPGLDSPLYTIETGKGIEEFFLKTDKILDFKIEI